MINITIEDHYKLEKQITRLIHDGFDELVEATHYWLEQQDTQQYYQDNEASLYLYITSSNLNDTYNNIIEDYSDQGAKLTRNLYQTLQNRQYNNKPPTQTKHEKNQIQQAMDNTYNLIHSTLTDEASALRRKITIDYNNHTITALPILLLIQQDPINGRSPETRATNISITEASHIINLFTLLYMLREKKEYATLQCMDDACEECLQYQGQLIPLQEANNIGLLHPNCRCTWIPATFESETPQEEVKQE